MGGRRCWESQASSESLNCQGTHLASCVCERSMDFTPAKGTVGSAWECVMPFM